MATIKTLTADTRETRTVRALPSADRSGDGYDYIATLNQHGWHELASWGTEGWDLGAWPYVIFAVNATEAAEGEQVYGLGEYCEGDTSAEYFDSREALHEAISRRAFFYWKLGQADGPSWLPEAFEDLPTKYRRPYAP